MADSLQVEEAIACHQPAKGVCATEGYNFLVVEAHSVEDIPQVGGPLGGIGQTAIRRALGLIVLILPAWPPLDVRPYTMAV